MTHWRQNSEKLDKCVKYNEIIVNKMEQYHIALLP